MAKTITNPVSEQVSPVETTARSETRPAVPAGRTWPLLLIVLVCGAAGMALEMTASRMLAPHFGSSLYIWAILIGLVMIFLTIGYSLGGRLADRAPRPLILYGIVAAAGAWALLLPLLSGPILTGARDFPSADTGVEYGSLLSIVLLFGVPTILLGCVSPFAIRLRLRGVRVAGNTAGSLYALATLGSIAGTFVPVFLLLPYLGVAATLYLTGGALLLVALLGWVVAPNPPAPFPRGEGGETFASPAGNEAGGEDGARALPAAATAVVNPPSPPRGEVRLVVLLLAVGIAGMATLGLEMIAAHLLRPYFGGDQFIWANLIGLVLIYLTIGYYLGGRLADRHPDPGWLFRIIAIAGLAAAVVPLLAQPLLTWSLTGMAQISVSIFYGSLAGVIGLFAIPFILLGCVSPFAIRLQMRGVDGAGATAGSIYSVSTLGSILGTFIPVFVLLPNIGSGRTLYLFAGALLLVATLGLWVMQLAGSRLVAAALLGVVALGLLPPPALIKPPPYGKLLTERESIYNYIQVVRTDNGDVHLVLNEGHAIHSLYRADQSNPLTGGPWDYWLVAPYVNANVHPADVQSMLMLGSAAGTAAQLFTRAYGPKPVDNVEIDPEIVDLAHQYFHLDQSNIHNIIQDARVYLRMTDKKYTVVGIDAYRQPYIPFHLTTREFFSEVRDKLDPNGVVMINAGRAGSDYRLVNVIAATMRSVFPHVYIIDVASMGNSMIIGSMQGDGLANFKANAAYATDPLLQQVFAESIDKGNMREVEPASVTGEQIFTDDRAPVEQVIDQLILNYVGSQ